MELDTVSKLKDAFYRLTGVTESDATLQRRGESAGDVANYYLTRGARAAQRYMIQQGYGGWRKNSSALSFTDNSDGSQKVTLPSDFLRAYGRRHPDMSALVDTNGDAWGTEIHAEEDYRKGDLYYFRGDELYLARQASPPTTLYLDYHYLHPSFEGLADADIDFPVEARPLIVAEAADQAKEDAWLPGGREMEQRIARALARAQADARRIARPSRQPRTFRKAPRYGNRW